MPGKLNVIPDAWYRLFRFEASEAAVAPILAPICGNLPKTVLQEAQPHRPYHLSTEKLGDVESVMGDRELFSVSPIFVSST